MPYQFYREHKYVSSALNDLERLIARTDFSDTASVEEVKRAFEDLAGMLQGHAEYENARLHALLKQKNAPASIYLDIEEDHAEQEKQLQKIREILQRIPTLDTTDKVETGYQLYLTYRKFVADNLAHLHEEETKILPELQKLYTDNELRLVEASTYQAMSPEEIVDMIQLLFPHMNTHDKQAFLLDIKTLAPEKFDRVQEIIESLTPSLRC